MTEIHELNELEIDEISLVDIGANEGAKMVLMKRYKETDETTGITKRLAQVEIEKAALIEERDMAVLAKRAHALWPNLSGSDTTKARVLKQIDGLSEDTRDELLQFFTAANQAMAQLLAERGVTVTGQTENMDDAQALDQMAQDFATENNISVPVAKKRLVAENKQAAVLFKRLLKSGR